MKNDYIRISELLKEYLYILNNEIIICNNLCVYWRINNEKIDKSRILTSDGDDDIFAVNGSDIIARNTLITPGVVSSDVENPIKVIRGKIP